MPRSWNDDYVIFNDSLIVESSGLPRWLTVVAGTGNAENRRPIRSRPRWTVNLTNLMLTPWQNYELMAFQYQVQGRLNTFLLRNSRNCLLEDPRGNLQGIGEGDGTQTSFQLVKTYPLQGKSVDVEINYPNHNYPALEDFNGKDWDFLPELEIFLDGTKQPNGWSVDRNTGIVTFNVAPADGVEVAAAGGFYTLMRMDVEGIETTPDGPLFKVTGTTTFSEPEGGS